MTTVAEITIPTTDFALAETSTQLPDLEIRVKSVVAEGPLRTMPLLWFGNVDHERLEPALEDDSTVDEYTRLLEDPEADEWLYRVEYTSLVIDRCREIFDRDGTILDAHGVGGRWTLRLLFPDRDSLSAAVEALEEQGVTVDVKRMVDAGRNGDLESTAALTEAQEEAIAEAYRQGYFDVPRRTSLEDLAAELDVSHQALSERLRRANKELASEQLGSTVIGSRSD